ncbi:hypothetical protein Tco_0032186 [Tanacetum coccineum]
MNQEVIQLAACEEAWVPKADKAFLASADAPEIYMQQFWFIVTKIKDTNFYEFKLANKKCLVDVDVFRQALDICLRVPEKEFIVPPSEEELLTFLIGLGYKGELTHLPQMFIDHMHQPWRTIASIINKCLSGKTTSNDRLRQSRVAIIWGMFHKKYVDFAELIWEDFSYQIDNRQLKKSICEIMPYPRFTKRIINHFLSIHKSVPKALPSGLHTIKDDGVLSRMKFQSDTYKAFINYSTGLVPLNKTRGKGSQGKKSAVTPKPASIEVSDESDSKPARRRTSSRRIYKKKVSISADDNIIPEPDVALELGKSISLTEVAEEEVSRQVHATYERIITVSDPEPARRRPSGIAFRDTSSVSKKISLDPSQKLKGIQTLTAEEQLAADMITGTKPGVPDESTVILTPSSERTGSKPGVPDEVKDISEAKADVTLDWGSEEESVYSKEENVDKEIDWVYFDEEEKKKDDDKSIDIEETDNEETDDEFVQGNEYVQDDVDKEIKDAKVAESEKGDEEITNMTKANAKKSEEVKDDNKKAKLPPSSSSLSVSSGFGNQFLNLSSDKSISPSILTVPVSVIPKPAVLSSIPEIPTVTSTTTPPPPHYISTISHLLQQTTTPIPTPPITTVAPAVTIIPDPLPAIIQRVSVLEKDVQKIKEVDHTITHLALLRSEIMSVVNAYLGSSLGDALQKSVQENVINEVKNLLPKFLPKAVSDFVTLVIQSIVKKALEKTLIVLVQYSYQDQSSLKAVESLFAYALKKILFEKINKRLSYLTHDMHQGKKTKRRRTKESESSKNTSTTKETSKGNAPTKGSKYDKSIHVEESVAEPTENVIINASNDDVVMMLPTPDPEWNKGKAIDDSQEYTWFNDLLSAKKGPLKFDELMATPTNFSKFAMNRLKIDKLIKAHLNNPEGDRCPFDLSKPLPLKGRLGRLTVASEYFFNNDLEYQKSSDPKKKMSIKKTKAARYELVGIKDMISSLWSVTKVGYNKDAERGINHWGPKRQLFYRSQINKFSKHDVYLTQNILSVVSVKVNKLHGYGHLEEIMVRRADRQLYTFKEGDFVDLHLNNIEDMLLLAAQHKLFQLDESDIINLVVALRMFTRSLIIKRRVKDVQLGVESYQKKLNITKPQKDFLGISAKELYKPSFDPPGVIYEDLNKQKRVMRDDELYKFLDRTLKLVRDELRHRILNFCLGFNKEMSRRKWSAIDKRR